MSAAATKISAQTETDDTRPLDPETRLFRHVILVAALDAVHGSTVSNERNRQTVRAQAMGWFVHNSDDFRTVCECAGLDPDHVRKNALKYIIAERDANNGALRPRQRPKLRNQASFDREHHVH